MRSFLGLAGFFSCVLACSSEPDSEAVGYFDSAGGVGGTSSTASSQGAMTTGAPTSGDTTGGTATTGPVTMGGFGMSSTSSSTTGISVGSGGMSSGSGGTTDTGMSSSASGTSATGGGTTGSGECMPRVDCNPEPLPSTGDYHQDCVDRVNQFRVECWCLPPLARWNEGENCADEHSQYDSEVDDAHAGFSDRICDNGGRAQNECPGWRSEEQIIEGCLQMMYDEGPPPSEPCNGQCFQEHGHFINMTNENYSMVACGFYTTPNGQVWSVQNFQ